MHSYRTVQSSTPQPPARPRREWPPQSHDLIAVEPTMSLIAGWVTAINHADLVRALDIQRQLEDIGVRLNWQREARP